jgi:hypothetical protein
MSDEKTPTTPEKDKVHIVVSAADTAGTTQTPAPSNGAMAPQAPAPTVAAAPAAPAKTEKLGVLGSISKFGNTEVKVKHIAYAVGGAAATFAAYEGVARWRDWPRVGLFGGKKPALPGKK